MYRQCGPMYCTTEADHRTRQGNETAHRGRQVTDASRWVDLGAARGQSTPGVVLDNRHEVGQKRPTIRGSADDRRRQLGR